MVHRRARNSLSADASSAHGSDGLYNEPAEEVDLVSCRVASKFLCDQVGGNGLAGKPAELHSLFPVLLPYSGQKLCRQPRNLELHLVVEFL